MLVSACLDVVSTSTPPLQIGLFRMAFVAFFKGELDMVIRTYGGTEAAESMVSKAWILVMGRMGEVMPLGLQPH